MAEVAYVLSNLGKNRPSCYGHDGGAGNNGLRATGRGQKLASCNGVTAHANSGVVRGGIVLKKGAGSW